MLENKTNTLVIRTPEGISFSLLLAGPVTRFFAWIIDFFVIMLLMMIFSMAVTFISFISMDLSGALSVLVYFVISIGYGILTEWYFRGQTLGKKLLKLRVMDARGLRLQFSQVVIRNLLRFIDSMPVFYLVGGISTLINKKSQRLGDFAANTIVVRSRPDFNFDHEKLSSGKFNSFRSYPHLEARLRQRVSPEEAALCLQALVRRDELDPQARVALMKEFADHFKSYVEFPEDSVFGITDEQYLKNVVDSLFKEKHIDGKNKK